MKNSKVIATGDANLCAERWRQDGYNKKGIASPLLQCLERNGLDIHNIGYTYQSDKVLPNGQVSQSALDHVYTSANIGDRVCAKKILNRSPSSSDFIQHEQEQKTVQAYGHEEEFKEFYT